MTSTSKSGKPPGRMLEEYGLSRQVDTESLSRGGRRVADLSAKVEREA